MAESMRVQTGSGVLIVTENSVTLDRPAFGITGHKTQSIMRSAITSIEDKVTVPAVFGRGGGMRIIIHSQGGDRMELNFVPMKAAQQLLALLR